MAHTLTRVLFSIFLFGSGGVGSASAQDIPDPFLLEIPNLVLPFEPRVAHLRETLFVVGTSRGDAALVAWDTGTDAELWRALVGERGLVDSYIDVTSVRGSVCAAGLGLRTRPDPDLILVGCYFAKDGTPIWEKQVVSPVGFFPNVRVEQRGGKVVVTIVGSVIMLFDLRDGTP